MGFVLLVGLVLPSGLAFPPRECKLPASDLARGFLGPFCADLPACMQLSCSPVAADFALWVEVATQKPLSSQLLKGCLIHC